MSLLSNKYIKEYMKEGEIIIEPYNENNLNTSSYDVRLGEYYFKEKDPAKNMESSLYNIYSKKDVYRIWSDKPKKAKPYSYYKNKGEIKELKNVKDEDLIIILKPGENILAHTQEYIGGVKRTTTMMKSRSSMGRNNFEVCKCSGMGDVGYYSRWTMEIKNNSKYYTIPLVVGRRVAQILFFDVKNTTGKSYNKEGKYQTYDNIEEIKKNWSPYDMLPKMYNDFDIVVNK